MHCTQCSHRLGAADKFCAGCGHAVSGNRPPDRPRQPFSNPAGKAAHAALMVAKEERVLRRGMVLGVLYLVVPGLVGLTVLARPGPDMWSTVASCYVFGLIPFAVFALLLMNKRVSEDEYYGLPGSRGSDGGHRCIHCGHRGIYVRGEYRTNFRHHNCSKCKTNLFTTNG